MKIPRQEKIAVKITDPKHVAEYAESNCQWWIGTQYSLRPVAALPDGFRIIDAKVCLCLGQAWIN